MASPSRPPSFKDFNVKAKCYGCQRKVTYADGPLWFVRSYGPQGNAVFAWCCWKKASRWDG